MSDKPFSDEQMESIFDVAEDIRKRRDWQFVYMSVAYRFAIEGKSEGILRLIDTIADGDKRIAERDTELNVWRTSFGSPQLTHAIAIQESKDKRIERLEQALGKIEKLTDGHDGEESRSILSVFIQVNEIVHESLAPTPEKE